MEVPSGKPIRISVSGGIRLFDAAGEEIRLSLVRSNAAMAYLAFSDTDIASRDQLAGLLWSERENAAARQSLRQVALQLRNFARKTDPDFIKITNKDISLRRSFISSELDFLTNPIELADQFDFSSIPQPEQMLTNLDGIDDAFDDWLRSWRITIKKKMRAALVQLTCEETLRTNKKTEIAESLLRIDPTSKIAARYLIEIAAENQDSAAMLRVYQNHWDALAEEWDEEPSGDIQDLFVEKRMMLGEASAPRQQANYLANEDEIKQKREFLSVLVIRLAISSTSALLDLEELESILRSNTNKIVGILKPFGCTSSVGSNGEIIAVFGPLSTGEEDIQNALDAALNIDAALNDAKEKSPSSVTISHAIGIDSGIVHLRISEDGAVLYDIFGPAFSNASELSRRTNDEKIFVTDQSVRRLRTAYSFSPAQSLTIQQDIITINALRGKLDSSHILTDEAWHAENTFVGRSDFLTNLNQKWAAAQDHHLQRAVVLGEPGVGKTRLILEFLRQRAPETGSVHFVRCRRQDQSAPLEPMHTLRESLCTGSQLASFSKEHGRGNVQNELESELLNALSEQTTIIVFDDWQWADDASRVMLGKLIDESQDQPILLLFTIRGEEMIDAALLDVEPMLLPAMDVDEVLETAGKLLGWHPEERLKRDLYKKSGGNPFFIEELCHLLRQDPNANILDFDSDDLPGTMRAMILARLENLTPLARRIIETTAIYGEGLTLALLETIIGEPVDRELLAHLANIGILASRSPEDDLYFKHGITFEVVYKTIALERRRELHTRFATALEEQIGKEGRLEIAEQLAFHFRGAGKYSEAVTHAVLAGDKAIGLSSLDRAMVQYGAALELMDQCEDNEENRKRWLMIAMCWGLPCIYAPSRNQIPVLKRAIRVAREFNDHKAMAVVHHWIGYIQLVIGDHGDAIKRLTKAEDLSVRARSERLTTDIMATRGFAHAARCDYDRAIRDIEAALKKKDENPGKGNNVPILSSYARATLGLVKSDIGDFDEGHRLIDAALDSVKRFDHEIESSICNLGSAILLWQGRWSEALDRAAQSCRRSEIVNSPYLINMARCLFGYASWRETGSLDGIKTLTVAADRLWESEMRMYNSFCYGWVSDVHAITGQHETAFYAAERTLELAEAGDSVGATMALRSLSMLAASKPDKDKDKAYQTALTHLENAYAHAENRSSPHEKAITDLHKARLIGMYGESADALSILAEVAVELEKLNMQWHLLRADKLGAAIREGSLDQDPSRICKFLL